MLKNGKHSPCGSTNSYLKAGAGVEPHLIRCSPKAIVYVSRCSVEKQFSGQRQSPELVPRPKELNQWRTCSSSIEGLSQQPVDNRWKSTTLPRHRSHALPHPKYSSCAAGCSTMLISPILHTPWGEWGKKLKKKIKKCKHVWLCSLPSLCSGSWQAPGIMEDLAQLPPSDSQATQRVTSW